jgi:ribosome-binding factor A
LRERTYKKTLPFTLEVIQGLEAFALPVVRTNLTTFEATQLNTNNMDSTRQNKISRLLQKDLAEIIQKEGRDIFPGVMVSVTNVRISPDLSIARVYLSIFPSEKGAAALLEIKKHTSKIRGLLGIKVGKQLRIVPQLDFHIDDSLDYIDNIDRLLKE